MFLHNDERAQLIAKYLQATDSVENGKFCSSKAIVLFRGGQFVCPLHLEVRAHKLARAALCCR